MSRASRRRRQVISLTVGAVVRQVLPEGTRRTFGGQPNFKEVLELPPDLFAVAAHLLHLSGAYHHIVMDPDDSSAPAHTIAITSEDREKWIRIGKNWSIGPATRKPPKEVQALWTKLHQSFEQPISAVRAATTTKIPNWWTIAYALMAIADEASANLGYLGSSDRRTNWIERTIRDSVTRPPRELTPRSQTYSQPIVSIATDLVNPDVVCVQAKARTPNVGVALRNISHNLALLPPRKEVAVHWQAPFTQEAREDTEPLNLLLIPFPYVLADDDFHVVSTGWERADKKACWFGIRQRWLNVGASEIIRFVEALIRQAPLPINGIVFPEFALNWTTYERLARRLRDRHPGIEFLVSGSSNNCGGEIGNFALATHFFGESKSSRKMASMSRSKHHRWMLDNYQCKRYLLTDCLPPLNNGGYWEHIPLGQREIHVSAFRSSSVFTVMICEDLARSDPVHEPLRAVGPNLVFVLLMDGPQLEGRWSARYSLGLAEDPGSSVLTLTSRALVARVNAHNDPQSWSIGLWQDGDGKELKKIACPPGTDAVIVSLSGERATEATLDGRSNTQTFVWRHRSSLPIKLTGRYGRLRTLVGADKLV